MYTISCDECGNRIVNNSESLLVTGLRLLSSQLGQYREIHFCNKECLHKYIDNMDGENEK